MSRARSASTPDFRDRRFHTWSATDASLDVFRGLDAPIVLRATTRALPVPGLASGQAVGQL